MFRFSRSWLMLVSVALPLGSTMMVAAAAEKRPVLVSVHSRTDGTYQRTKLADGTFQPEFYAISNGGIVAGSERDAPQEQMDVGIIVKAIAEHLAAQQYFLAPDTKAAQLLLVVQWGRTIPFNDINYRGQVGQTGAALNHLQNLQGAPPAPAAAGSPEAAAAVAADNAARLQSQMQAVDDLNSQLFAMQVQNDLRDQNNLLNAQLLGYLDEINAANDPSRFAGNPRYDELRADIEEARYYIVISAYDFQVMTEKQERKLRWVTRMSIRARGNSFSKHVDAMVARAARYFGADSGKLIREYEGTVELGEAQVVGFEEPPPAPPEAGDGAGQP